MSDSEIVVPNSNTTQTETPGRATAEFRPIVGAAFVGGALIPGAIAIIERGIGSWVGAAISIGVLAIGVLRFRKEKLLVRDRATTLARITAWEKTENSDGGFGYLVRYRFIGPDNKTFMGKSDSTAEELPQTGEVLPISYKQDDPSQNLPLATFWFYRFIYTGFARWI